MSGLFLFPIFSAFSSCAELLGTKGLGKLTKVFSSGRNLRLSNEYEAEPRELTVSIKAEQTAVDTYEQDKADFDSFAAIIQKYDGIKKLTLTIVNGFVKKIIVHASNTSSGHRRQKIQIIRNFIEELEQYKDKQTAKQKKEQDSIAFRLCRLATN